MGHDELHVAGLHQQHVEGVDFGSPLLATLDQRPSPQLPASSRPDWQQRRLKELVRLARSGLLVNAD